MRIGDSIVVSPATVFSDTYYQARDKFRQAADKANAELHAFPVNGNEYTMDIAVMKGTLPGTVVHTSGYHGVEGYAGSAIQVAWLQNPPKDIPTVVLVHAVNPYGMATFRRTNENNVDLNRNGLHADDWNKALQRDANIQNYQDFESLLNPRRAPTLLDRYLRIYVTAAVAILRNGLATLKRAMVTGQYHDPQGIFYGGQELQPSLRILWDFLKTHVSQQDKVTMVNVHTGLGPSGYDTILTGSHAAAISPHALSHVFANSSIPSLSQSASDVSAGYDMVMGTAEHFFAPLFHKDADWIVTQEFGTIPMPLVGIALILENMARQYLPETQAMEWTELTRRAFYKKTPKWRKDVVVRGLRVLQQAIKRTTPSSGS